MTKRESASGRAVQGIMSLIEYLSVIALVTMTIVVGISITARYGFGRSFRWGEEITTILFTYLCFLAIPVVLWEGDHIRIEFFLSALPRRIHKGVSIFVDFVSLAASLLLGISGFQVLYKVGMEPMPATKLPVGIIYAAACLSGLLMSFYLVKKIRNYFMR